MSAQELLRNYLSTRARWFTTVGTLAFLGGVFLAVPEIAMRLMEIPDSIYTRTVFRLYGALLLNRALFEQVVRMRRDVGLVRGFMIANYPFTAGSTVILAYAVFEGLMNPIIGFVFIAMFFSELVEFTIFLIRSKSSELKMWREPTTEGAPR